VRSSAFLAVVATLLLGSLAGGTEVEKTKALDSGLRGPVRLCVEKTTYLADGTLGDRSFTTVSLYSTSGWLLERRSEQSSGPEYVTTYSYDAAGRLLNSAYGPDGSDSTKRVGPAYSYDDKGQLLSVRSDAENVTVSYEYDGSNPKRRVERLPVFQPLAPNTAIGAIKWEDSELQFAPPSGGAITTLYDKQGRPVEGQVTDSDGRLMLRIVRTYDPQGRVQSDKMTPVDMAGQVPEELAGQFNQAQKQALAKFIGNSFASGESAFKYDAQGRMIEKRSSGGVSGNLLIALNYNEHGDVSSEVMVATLMAGVGVEYGMTEDGKMIAQSEAKPGEPTQSESRYTYEYDAHGNWTRKTTASRSGPGEFRESMIIERTLSYY
jgi:YD repeat-containing protein